MDDHELGALIDAAVPAKPASDAALSHIERRAAQRRRRAAVGSGALTIVVVAAVALAISALGGASRSTSPAGETSGSNPVATTMVLIPSCRPGDVSMTINPRSASFNGTTTWGVTAVSHAAAPCRLVAPLTGSIRNRAGQVLIADYGPNHGRIRPGDPGYVNALVSDTPTLVAQISWTFSCFNVPTQLEVSGISAAPARLAVPARPCPPGSIGQSSFRLSGGAVGIAGGPCPFGSLTLAIDPHAVRTNAITRWPVTATSNVGVLCRIASGLGAAIETPNGKGLGGVTGNPAQQSPDDSFQDLVRPDHSEFMGYLSWTNACSDGPVRLVVRFENASYGSPATLVVTRPRCAATNPGPSHFEIDAGVPTTPVGATTTTATP